MSFTADIYKEICVDIAKNSQPNSIYAMRMLKLPNGINIAFSINALTYMRGAFFSVDSEATANQFPHWKGVDIVIAKLPAYGTDQKYVNVIQLPGSANDIFEIIVEDLRSELENCSDAASSVTVIAAVLAKWREFFKTDKELIMSEERQQGLYGELLFLEECLEIFGSTAISQWAGSNNETHDFYFSSNAVEVKTTASQAPYYAHISSEYQLDNNDIPGKLFLRFYAFRKSQSSGDKLPDVVGRIRQVISHVSQAMQSFTEKIQKYGYYDEAADYYSVGYFVRDQYYFAVEDGFARITKTAVPTGVTDLTYAVNIAQCIPFAVDKNSVFAQLKGGANNVK